MLRPRFATLLAALALAALLAAHAAGAATGARPYTRAATRACLLRLPGAVVGLPPASPSSALFVYALTRDDVSTWGLGGRPPRPHSQLGVWSGDGNRGIILTFFRNAADARASVAGQHEGRRLRNVVASWGRSSQLRPSVLHAVLDCLGSAAAPAPNPVPPRASLATFAGAWGGHTRSLTIAAGGQGRESADDGCCMHEYRLTFRILSVSGTLTHATAVYRVLSFRRYDPGVARLRVGQIGRLQLRDGIVTNLLTRDFFCSDPAWGATEACGA